MSKPIQQLRNIVKTNPKQISCPELSSRHPDRPISENKKKHMDTVKRKILCLQGHKILNSNPMHLLKRSTHNPGAEFIKDFSLSRYKHHRAASAQKLDFTDVMFRASFPQQTTNSCSPI